MNLVDIANLALNHLGIGKTIASLTESSEEAAAINSIMEIAINSTLQDGIWAFAKKRTSLGLIGTLSEGSYKYQYSLPSDCIRIFHLASKEPFEFLFLSTGIRTLVTNDSQAVLVYQTNAVDSTAYPPGFIMALSYKIASLVAFRLTGKAELVEYALKMYEHHLLRALSVDYNEEKPLQEEEESEFIKARY